MPARGIYNLVKALSQPYVGAHVIYKLKEFSFFAEKTLYENKLWILKLTAGEKGKLLKSHIIFNGYLDACNKYLKIAFFLWADAEIILTMLFGKKDIVGIDIGSKHIRAIHLKDNKGNYRLERLGIISLQP